MTSSHTRGALECFVNDFRQGRVRVHHHAQLLYRGTGRHGVGTLLNQVGRMQTNNVHGNDLARFFIVKALGHASTFAFGEGLGVGAKASNALAHGPAFLFGLCNALLLRGPNHGNLGMRKTRLSREIRKKMVCVCV